MASLLERSFDAGGVLSTKMYPQLAELRKEIERMSAAVTRTMDAMLKDRGVAATLQDNFYTMRDNRFVLPVAAVNKNKVSGIVHGVSGTGSTVYIEPQEVIDLNNKLRLAEGELRAEENRILKLLSSSLGSQSRQVAPPAAKVNRRKSTAPLALCALSPALRTLSPAARACALRRRALAGGQVRLAVLATKDVDVAAARERFATDMQAVRPEVRAEGAIELREVRHPVLVLRGAAPVDNDVSLDAAMPALVISGPNAGGKTVVLKAVGLCALLVQHGCFVPAREESRVDLFADVLASIGDQQAVQEGLSSFSSHLRTLDAMIQRSSAATLLLLDEIASGTDPAQGAALAQAVLDELLARGAKRFVTTHYAQVTAAPPPPSYCSPYASPYCALSLCPPPLEPHRSLPRPSHCRAPRFLILAEGLVCREAKPIEPLRPLSH